MTNWKECTVRSIVTWSHSGQSWWAKSK